MVTALMVKGQNFIWVLVNENVNDNVNENVNSLNSYALRARDLTDLTDFNLTQKPQKAQKFLWVV